MQELRSIGGFYNAKSSELFTSNEEKLELLLCELVREFEVIF